MNDQSAGRRFAAKLLFQFRVVIDGDSGKRRLCEERIINFAARGPRDAFRKAKRYGKSSEHDYENSDGNPVYFEFVGVLDLMELGIECEACEVWYELRRMLTPSERAGKILPEESKLIARME